MTALNTSASPAAILAHLQPQAGAAPLAARIAGLREKNQQVADAARAARGGKFDPAQASAKEQLAGRLSQEANELCRQIAEAEAELRRLRLPYVAEVERLLTPNRQVAIRALAKLLAPGLPIPPNKSFDESRINIPKARAALDHLDQIDAAMKGAGCEGFWPTWVHIPLAWGRIYDRLRQYRALVGE